MKNCGYYQSPIGLIEVVAEDGIMNINFVEKINDKLIDPNNSVINNCLMQLDKYFKQELTDFELPLSVAGTAFQKLVWKEACNIPYGKTITYQQLAQKIKRPKAYRAVGTALGKNRLAILIPCHRIVNNDKKTINYGWGRERKIFLQQLELTKK